MKVKTLLKSITVVVIAIAALVSLSACGGGNNSTDIVLSKDGTSEYIAIYGADNNKGGSYAYSISEAIGVRLVSDNDSAQQTQKEILIGDTNRQLSLDLKAAAHANAASDSHVWGFAYRDGKFAFYFNTQVAFEKGLAEFKATFLKDGAFVVSSDTWTVEEFTLADYEAILKAEADKLAAEEKAKKEAEFKARLEAAKAKYAELLKVEYEDIATLTPEKKWTTAPADYPTKGEHPRVMINASMIPKIKAWINDPSNETVAEQFWKMADSDTDGTFPDVETLGKTYNYDGNVIATIEAKALAYVITGNETYAWEAIVGVKNIANTMKITEDLFVDLFRGWGYAMLVTAEVYDWCYDLMTDEDRAHMVAGAQQKLCKGEDMTIGFPPAALNNVAGHGTNCQIQRDYLAFSIAIYDEHPDWYEYVARRLYSEYVPVNSVYYKAGFISQGTACYIYNKYYSQLWSEYLIRTMGGDPLYDSEGMEQVMISALCHLLPNGRSFQTGDGVKSKDGTAQSSYASAVVAAALFDNPTILANAKHYSNGFTSQAVGISSNMMSTAMMAIFVSQCTDIDEDRLENLPMVQYNGSPIGQMIARNSWGSNAAVTFMKIGELTNGNHEHQDSGTFQIYYKGLLTTSSGTYSGNSGADYGSIHHLYYHQGTVAQNGLLIYNDSKASTLKGWYSGGQKSTDSPSTYENWISGKFNVAEQTGHATDYNKTSGTVNYAYIAGDLTAAYDQDTVDRVERRMLTVYTGNEKFPMIFVVYDNIVSDSAEYKKTFLLHTAEAPEIDGKFVTIANGDGKLVLQNIIGGDSIKAIGGEGKTFWVNDTMGNADKHHTDPNGKVPEGDQWGRVEISTVGNKQSEFLNVMHVSDRTEKDMLIAVPVNDQSGVVSGAVIGKYATVFVKSLERRYEEFSFSSAGTGSITYYVSGVYEGKWDIFVNGTKACSATATKDGGLLTFTAPAGNVTVKPSSSLIAPDSGAIIYHNITSDTTLPENAPNSYKYGTVTELPIPTRPDAIFVGWYTNAQFSGDRITEISADKRTDVRVFAKWRIVNICDFNDETFDYYETDVDVDGFHYVSSTKTGSRFKTVKDQDGNTCLEWTKGDLDPEIWIMENLGPFMGDDTVAVYTLSLAKVEGAPVMMTQLRLKGKTAAYSINAVTVTAEGEVLLNGNAELKLFDLTYELKHLFIEVDFGNSVMTAFSSDGSVLQSTAFAPKAEWEYASTVDWMKDCSYVYDLYIPRNGSSNDAKLLVDNIATIPGEFDVALTK